MGATCEACSGNLEVSGTITAFAVVHRETKKNLCRAVLRSETLCLFHLHRWCEKEESTKTEQSVPKRRHTKFRSRGIIQKKVHNKVRMYTNSFTITALPWWGEGEGLGGGAEGCLRTGVTGIAKFSFVGYYLTRPLSKDFKNGVEAYGVLFELGVQFYGLCKRYFSQVSECLPLHILNSWYTRFLKYIYLHVIN